MADEYIQGLSELVSKLNDLPLALGTQKNIIVRCLRKGAEPIRMRAAELAPVMQGPEITQKRRGRVYVIKPGQLRDSMYVQVSDQTATGAVAKIGPSKAGWYGGWQEKGSAHNAAQPFLRPAFDEKIDEAVGIIGTEMAEQIEKELRKTS